MTESDDRDPGFPTKEHSILPNTSSDSCFKLAKSWISMCVKDHTRCTQTTNAVAYYPTRLIEIGAATSVSDAELYLRVTHDHLPTSPHMTRSHCWGTAKFLTLTQSTYEGLKGGFSPADLPKTIQDAFTITRELGVRYLWIDSLCIFQDSTEDWRYEALQMRKVCQHSFCNVAASAAANGNEGCFRARETPLIEPLIIKSEWNDTPDQS